MNWPRIYAIFATGVAAAFLIGKAPAALPVLRDELHLSLFQAGLVVALFSVVAAIGGIFFGALSDRFGQRRLAITGLLITIVAGTAGASTTTPEALIATRIAEGIGFFMLSVSLPAMIVRLASDKNRSAAMGLWGAYLPLGAGLILLSGGILMTEVGWRGLWIAIAVASTLMLLPLIWAAPGSPRTATSAPPTNRVRAVLTSRGPVLLAMTFGFYSSQYVALTSFIPLILVEKVGWSLPAAALAGAIVMLANVTGNIAAGYYLNRGVDRATLILIAAAAMALGAILVMTEGLPIGLRLAGAILFSSLGGLIPGALFAGVPEHAPSPNQVSSVNGLMLQSVAIGQLIGPVATTSLVHLGGGSWGYAMFYLLPMAALTAAAGIALGRLERS